MGRGETQAQDGRKSTMYKRLYYIQDIRSFLCTVRGHILEGAGARRKEILYFVMKL